MKRRMSAEPVDPKSRKRKRCPFTAANFDEIDYKDIETLSKFITERVKFCREELRAFLPIFSDDYQKRSACKAHCAFALCRRKLTVRSYITNDYPYLITRRRGSRRKKGEIASVKPALRLIFLIPKKLALVRMLMPFVARHASRKSVVQKRQLIVQHQKKSQLA